MLKTRVNLVDGPLLPNIIRYTIPIIFTNLLQLLFNAADLVVVGQYCGALSVAAVGATGHITGLVINFFIGLSVGVSVTAAQALGAKDHQMVRRTVHTALPTVLLCGAALTLFGLVFSEQLLIWTKTPEDVLPLSTLYMRIIFCGVPFSLAYNFMSAILRAAGDTKSPFIFLTASGVLNVILNVLFVTVFRMNVAGVALATILAQAVSAVLTVLALMRRTDSCRLFLSRLRIHAEPFKRILQLGIPAGIQSIIFALSNVLIQSAINSFGSTVVSGHSAAANIDGLVGTIATGFYMTAINFTGQNIGAGRLDRVKRTFIICTTCSMVFSFAAALLAYTFGPQLLSIYITDSSEAIGYGMVYMTYVILANAIMAFMWVPTGTLRGMGASTTTMLLTLFGCTCRVLWVYTLFQMPQFHKLSFLYLSYAVSWALIGICQLVAFILLYKRQKRVFLQTAVSKI